MPSGLTYKVGPSFTDPITKGDAEKLDELYGKPRQYSLDSEQERQRLARRLHLEYGFTWEELTKLTGMKLSNPR